jgi:membrane protein DedA with SNARE-associated domain
MGLFRRHGVLAVLIPAILPPPAPFKIFVLLAGVADISAPKFLTAVAVGRGARYLVLGILAVEYGERGLAYMQEHGVAVSLSVVGLLVAGLTGYALWRQVRRRARGGADLVS